MIPQQEVILIKSLATPLSRTPWAGRRIAEVYKNSSGAIGESWEFSCDPELPSRTDQLNFADLNQQQTRSIFGPNPGLGRPLLKILDTAADLSFQVHPDDNHPALNPEECGKPEAWLILHSQAGAGVYLGFKQSTGMEELSRVLARGEDLGPYLQFVEVKPGDYFEIPAGVPHAVGAGITLLEPQRTVIGKSGKTYRLWDWQRRYNSSGKPDPSGKMRECHHAEGLRALGDLERLWGNVLVRSLKVQPEHLGRQVYCYPSHGGYSLLHVRKSSAREIEVPGEYAVGVILEGEAEVGGELCPKGQSFLLPFSASRPFSIRVRRDSELAMMCPLMPPKGGKLP